jgi:transcriptional regulator with XRE-family HTH domain
MWPPRWLSSESVLSSSGNRATPDIAETRPKPTALRRVQEVPGSPADVAASRAVCDYRTMADDVEWTNVGERVREARLTAGLSQEDLGAKVGLDRTMIAKIEAGVRRVDALELIKLSSALSVPIDYVLQSPLPALSRRKELMTEDTETEIARQSERLEVELASWLRELRQLVDLGLLHPEPVLSFGSPVTSETEASEAARWTRDKLESGIEPIETLMDFCERAGQFVLVTEIPGDGASVVDGDIAGAVVSLRGDPGRRRATAAHELGHLIVGDEYSSDLGVHASRAEREAIIDAFAAELLLPVQVLAAENRASGNITRDRLVWCVAHYRTSWSLALRQASRAGVVDPQTRRAWTQITPTRGEFMEAVGWAPQPDLELVRVPPRYAHAVIEAWKRNLVTGARAVELMHGQISHADLPPRDETDVEP